MPAFLLRLNAALEGRYRVVREVGEGGMATVYLADDVRHGRKVALKVLKPELAAALGAERFLAEIRTTAVLQHPQILPLFDSGEADGLLFYVMPYVEGESVRDRLDRERQLPVDEAVRIATAVARALDYAHRHGVVHRDVKPSNILVHEGQPLIADFGIALALAAGSAGRLTSTGLSVGTPQYMSPEQATGDVSVGPATDVFALGCVLYEMLVGEPPYTGSTPQAILARIILAEPVSTTGQRHRVPANVDAAIRRALEKVPADRFATASDFAEALADPAFRHGHSDREAAASGRRARGAMWFALAAIPIAALAGWAVAGSLRPPAGAVTRFQVTPGEGERLASGAGGVEMALAPDGMWFVYVGEAPGGGVRLWRRDLDRLEATPIAGTDGARSPAVSPDGRSIAFSSDGAVRVLSLEGGLPLSVASGGAPAWGADGSVYFSRDGIIHRVAATGGEVEAVTAPAVNVTQMHNDVLPDGRGVLVTAVTGTAAQSRIAVAETGGGALREVLTGTMARYATTGHIVYATAGGTIMAAPFDLRRLEVTGPSAALVEGVAVDLLATSQFALSRSGTLLYATGAGSESELVWVTRAGLVEPVDPEWTGEFGSPVLSPDGGRVAVALQGVSSMDIWVKVLDRGPRTRLTLDGGRNDYPTWTPDGASITFTSDRASPSFDLWTKRADGVGDPVLEVDEEWAVAEAVWSPDGTWLLHRTSTNERGAGDIVGQRRDGDDARIPIVASEFTELAPALSPDGRWLAYSSVESGRTEVYVVPFPNTGDAKWPISVSGGTEPAWSRDGREIFYRSGQGRMVAAGVRTTPSFSVESTTVLFPDADYLGRSVHRQYDVSTDGQRFLMVRRVGAGHQSRLILVQNFHDELRRLAPR